MFNWHPPVQKYEGSGYVFDYGFAIANRGKRTRADRQQKIIQKRTNARQQREKSKRHNKRQRKMNPNWGRRS